MPTHFGPSVSPRQGPDGRPFDWSAFEWLRISAIFPSPPDRLERYMPPGFEPMPDPDIAITFSYTRNVPWLAGRGYNTFGINVPVYFRGKNRMEPGSMTMVLWENLAEPIITGREELGFSKLFCDLPDARQEAGGITCQASWMGFRFATLHVRELVKVDVGSLPDPSTTRTKGQLLHYRYMPATGDWGAAAVQEVTMTPCLQGGTTVRAESGRAKLQWNVPTWEDMPTQHRIVQSLAEVVSGEASHAEIVLTRGVDASLRNQCVVS
ncbi:MAG: acetoacetate decarboxylase family protein [Steroidobacteraceae bacterium]